MIFLFSEQACREEQEIAGILRAHGAGVLPGPEASLHRDGFFVLKVRAPMKIEAAGGAAIFTAACENFCRQRLPHTVTGICEEGNRTALRVLQASGVPVLSCGMDQRNTLTLSSISEHAVSAGLQRSLTDKNGEELFPAEYPISLSKPYSNFSVMAALAALLLEGIPPACF